MVITLKATLMSKAATIRLCDKLATEAPFLVIYTCLLLTKTYRFLSRVGFPWRGIAVERL